MPSSSRYPQTFANRCAEHLLRLYPPEAIRAVIAPAATKGQLSLTAINEDPSLVFKAMKWIPDPWQSRYLRSKSTRAALLCCRRAGKSVTSAAKTLARCLATPDTLTMVFTPTQRQSIEYARYVLRYNRAIGSPIKVERHNTTTIEWANGSRLMALPDSHEGVVGFTPQRIVIDEASRVSDVLYLSLRPMLALGAELELLSTPFGKRGFFFDIFNTADRLRRFASWKVTAAQCPRISREFLEEERVELGERWFNQEYMLTFNDSVDAVFAADVIKAMMRPTAGAMFELGV